MWADTIAMQRGRLLVARLEDRAGRTAAWPGPDFAPAGRVLPKPRFGRLETDRSAGTGKRRFSGSVWM